jgi:predicted transcriptional regulator
MKKYIALALLIFTMSSVAIEIGKVPAKITLDGENGSNTQGGVWHSTSLKGSMHLVIYMDPDERSNIEPLMKKIRTLKQPQFRTVAIVNLSATWKPNSVLMSKLKKGQKGMGKAIYLFDKKRVLVKQWDLKDDNTVAMVFDKKGKLLYKKTGPLSSIHIKNILAIIGK